MADEDKKVEEAEAPEAEKVEVERVGEAEKAEADAIAFLDLGGSHHSTSGASEMIFM